MTWSNLRLAKNNTLGIYIQSATFSYLHRHISILATRMGTPLSFWWQSSWTLSKNNNQRTLGTLVLWTHRQYLIHQLLTPSIPVAGCPHGVCRMTRNAVGVANSPTAQKSRTGCSCFIYHVCPVYHSFSVHTWTHNFDIVKKSMWWCPQLKAGLF